MGLDQVRDLTRRTIEQILLGRPFRSLDDFLTRVDPRPQEAANLVRVGALEGFGTIPSILRQVEGGGWQAGQPSLFEMKDVRIEENTKDWTLEQKVAAQQELLGVSLEAHPLELAADKIRAAGAISTVEAAGRIGQQVTVAGIRQSGHRSLTAKGEPMMFLTLEDLSGMLDVVLFPDAYRRARDIIHTSAPLLVTGVVEMDTSRGELLMKVERVAMLK
jgi:DNA polymerase III alpha subunit